MFHKMAQMIQMHTEKKLLDEVFATYRDVQDAAAEMARYFRALDAESRP